MIIIQKYIKGLAILIFSIAQIACGHTDINIKAARNVPAFELMAPVTLNQQLSAIQQIQAHIGDQNHTLEAAVEINGESINLALLSTLGQRMATLKYNGDQLDIQVEKLAPRKFPFKDMIAIMEMIFWPTDTLRDHFQDDAWHIEESQSTRDIYYEEYLVASIDYELSSPWEGKVTFRNMIYNYVFEIKSVLLN